PHPHAAAGAAARSTWRACKIPRIACRRRIEAGILRRYSFAEKHTTGLAKAPDDCGIPPSDALLPELRTGGGRPIEDIENVLDAQRNAVQRTAILATL